MSVWLWTRFVLHAALLGVAAMLVWNVWKERS